MSNKNIITTIWNAPTFEEVNEVVQALGGINAVCRITKKHRNTVSKWCKGDIQIDYANWCLISNLSGISISSIFTDKDIATVEVLHDRLLDLYGEGLNEEHLKKARKLTGKMYKYL